MPIVLETDEYVQWFRNLRDLNAKDKIIKRIRRLSLGNPGDVQPIGKGASELRMNFGPGYRVYYLQERDEITLLCGGDKSSQRKDILLALSMIEEP